MSWKSIFLVTAHDCGFYSALFWLSNAVMLPVNKRFATYPVVWNALNLVSYVGFYFGIVFICQLYAERAVKALSAPPFQTPIVQPAIELSPDVIHKMNAMEAIEISSFAIALSESLNNNFLNNNIRLLCACALADLDEYIFRVDSGDIKRDPRTRLDRGVTSQIFSADLEARGVADCFYSAPKLVLGAKLVVFDTCGHCTTAETMQHYKLDWCPACHASIVKHEEDELAVIKERYEKLVQDTWANQDAHIVIPVELYYSSFVEVAMYALNNDLPEVRGIPFVNSIFIPTDGKWDVILPMLFALLGMAPCRSEPLLQVPLITVQQDYEARLPAIGAAYTRMLLTK